MYLYRIAYISAYPKNVDILILLQVFLTSATVSAETRRVAVKIHTLMEMDMGRFMYRRAALYGIHHQLNG